MIRMTAGRGDAVTEAAMASTCSQAGERHGELAHKVVLGGVVVVLHHEAHQGQLGDLQLEAQRAVPSRVEACRGRTRAVNTGQRNDPRCTMLTGFSARLLTGISHDEETSTSECNVKS